VCVQDNTLRIYTKAEKSYYNNVLLCLYSTEFCPEDVGLQFSGNVMKKEDKMWKGDYV